MNKIRITPEAARDLQAVQSYIAQDLGNPAAAKRTVKSILQHLRVLERFANAGFSVAAKTPSNTRIFSASEAPIPRISTVTPV